MTGPKQADSTLCTVIPSNYEIVELSGNTEDVAAYAAAIALSQAEYLGHLGNLPITRARVDYLLNLPTASTYAICDASRVVLGAMSVCTSEASSGHARAVHLAYLFRLKSIRGNALGLQLLRYGLQRAVMQGVGRISLDVMSHNPARKLYSELGFTSYDDDYLEMSRSGSGDAIKMELSGEQAIQAAQARLDLMINQRYVHMGQTSS